MPEDILINAFNLPPEAAIKYLKDKGYAFSWDWQDLWQAAQAKSFTVAKAMRQDILVDIRDMVQRALNDGITYQQFKNELTPRLKAKGWWGKMLAGDVPGFDPTSGADPDKLVQLGSPWRLKTIYRTNLQVAYMAGRERGMEEVAKARPYWQYIAVLDSRTRPAHRAMHGKIFRWNDPFWDKFYPPNDWGCRCRVKSLSEREMERDGFEPEYSTGKIKTKEVLANENTGEMTTISIYRDPATGNAITTGPGWDYNPGRASWDKAS